MVFRVVSGQGTAPAFIGVALAFLGLFLLGWRLLARLAGSGAHRRPSGRPRSSLFAVARDGPHDTPAGSLRQDPNSSHPKRRRFCNGQRADRAPRVAIRTANRASSGRAHRALAAVKDAGGTPELIAPTAARFRRSTTWTRPTPSPRTARSRTPTRSSTPRWYARRRRQRRRAADRAGRGHVHAADVRGRQAGRGHLPWAVARSRGRLVRGRTLTSWPSLKTDIRHAGGNWTDTEVQVCTPGRTRCVTSRKPDDLARRSAGHWSRRSPAVRSRLSAYA